MAEISKNISNSCAMMNGTAERDPRCPWLTPMACDHELLCFPFVRHAGGRLGDIDRIGAGKAVLEALFERPLELAFASFLALAPRLLVDLVFGNRFVRNSHANLPAGDGAPPSRDNARDRAAFPGFPFRIRPV